MTVTPSGVSVARAGVHWLGEGHLIDPALTRFWETSVVPCMRINCAHDMCIDVRMCVRVNIRKVYEMGAAYRLLNFNHVIKYN